MILNHFCILSCIWMCLYNCVWLLVWSFSAVLFQEVYGYSKLILIMCIGKDSRFVTVVYQRYILAGVSKRPEAEWKKFVTKMEIVFRFLIEEGNKRGFDIDSILEIPTSTGSTCFDIAS